MTFPRLGALLMSTAICDPADIRYQAKHPQTRVHGISKAGLFVDTHTLYRLYSSQTVRRPVRVPGRPRASGAST